ncbi:pyrroloquinoline-quinone synthase PqqC [Ketobacter sp. MCCC 1A13808]|uniref:pyrroloquinoline-quinone synthase PqqC n=1 Tax=Ketobacter sp. MCCC 1A13808 TaxID=2602738 RepID=UPI000F1C91A9|nr:pyrroloquinoline-quinone synthase PqqC [Ketobacter sp. MCCC 1A13808]MVF13217.1 pyrroloquinoline-quinone synthase PqqC [Ketobacter sp. MCCC 1A13808]RLP54214.1 MAG: pyrroloquinoline quinone biosynthesis protein PqqC [Ketobacter sp.]
MNTPLTKQQFEQALRAKGRLYHIYHPFQVRMNQGLCTQQEIQGWVANRYYYQVNIPLKDAAILANCTDRDVRREWVQRILDHDGADGEEGGIEAWLRLGEAVGMSREDIVSQQRVLPGVRFACDAYVNFARRASWQEAACSSLTELFAPEIHRSRLDNWPQHYRWIEPQGYQYFQSRLSQARRDVEHGLRITLDYFETREAQNHALSILQFKLDVLWSMLDAMHMAYVHQQPPFHSCPLDVSH